MESNIDKEISPRWIKAMDAIHSVKYIPIIKNEISSRPDIQNKIKGFEQEFIKFAALERINYEADLDDELETYFKRKRLYSKNVKEWNRLRKAVFERDHYTCQYCGKKGGILEVDHVIPFSKGGSDDMSNLVTSCRKCNRQKNNMSKDDFLKWKNARNK